MTIATATGIMEMDSCLPSPALRPYVKHFLFIRSRGELLNRILPDTHLVMAFRISGQVNQFDGDRWTALPTAVVSGLRHSARLMNYTDGTLNLLVLFKEAGAAAFFNEPLNGFFNETVALDNIFSQRYLSSLEDELFSATTDAIRIQIIERFLLSRMRMAKPDLLITEAISRIRLEAGNIRIKELSDALFISQDAFEKRFRKQVGSTAKQFAKLMRLRSLINSGKSRKPFSSIALEAGFTDAPHFNKDFRLFTGQTPSDFFGEPNFW